MNKRHADISIQFLEEMIQAKLEQVKLEPDEPMWKDELQQLVGAQELIKMEDVENNG